MWKRSRTYLIIDRIPLKNILVVMRYRKIYYYKSPKPVSEYRLFQRIEIKL